MGVSLRGVSLFVSLFVSSFLSSFLPSFLCVILPRNRVGGGEFKPPSLPLPTPLGSDPLSMIYKSRPVASHPGVCGGGGV